jgi:DNA-binding response OmpR family regulator
MSPTPAPLQADPTAERTTLLLIDDDRELAGLLTHLFGREGFALRHAANGAAGLALLAAPAPAPALVLLDLMLPDRPGIEIFRALRERLPRLPVIMLTAKGDPVDRVIGLEVGADDYVPKPFDPRELVARIRAVLRRAVAPAEASPAHAVPVPLVLQVGPAVLDLTARTLKVGDKGSEREVSLTTLEFKLLAELARHPGQALSREALTQAVQAHNYRPLERAVDVQVARLRRKLREIDPDAAWILTSRGEGYVFAPPPALPLQ